MKHLSKWVISLPCIKKTEQITSMRINEINKIFPDKVFLLSIVWQKSVSLLLYLIREYNNLELHIFLLLTKMLRGTLFYHNKRCFCIFFFCLFCSKEVKKSIRLLWNNTWLTTVEYVTWPHNVWNIKTIQSFGEFNICLLLNSVHYTMSTNPINKLQTIKLFLCFKLMSRLNSQTEARAAGLSL